MTAKAGCTALLWLTLTACGSTPAADDPKPHDAGADSAVSDGSAGLLARLAQSRNAWDALAASQGDAYSYAEENCVVNATTHKVTTVQVEHDAARLFTTTTITTHQCLASVNRYADFQPRTLPELYAECKALIEREGSAVTVELDARSTIRGCTWPGPAGCMDNCGEGFYLRAVLFGQLEVP